jgi:YVTN family beta-propeller protein
MRNHALVSPIALLVTLSACGAMQSSPAGSTTSPTAGALASIPVGRGPTLLAMSPDGATVYAASVGKLFAINTASNTVAATADIDPYTTGLAVTPDGGTVLSIAMQSATLSLRPAAALGSGRTISLPLNLYPGGYGSIAVTADGGTAWLVNEALWLAIVDLGTGNARRNTLDMRPRDLALARDGRTVYVAGCKDYCTTGTVELIDVASGNPRSAVAVGPAPYRVALSPDERRLYTTNLAGPSLSIVDLSGATPTATLPVGTEPTGLAVSPDGARVYVVAKQGNSLTVARGDGSAVLATVPLAGMPRDVVLSPDGQRAYVSTSGPDAVVVLDTQRLASGG